MNKLIRKSLKLSCKVPYVTNLIRRFQKNKVAILMYHGLVQDDVRDYNWCLQHVSSFKEQMEFLKEEYVTLPLHEVVSSIRNNKKLPEYTAVVSFDDGIESVLTLGFPIMKSLNIPSSVFVVSSVIDSGIPAWSDLFYELVMASKRSEVEFLGLKYHLDTKEKRIKSYYKMDHRLKQFNNDERISQANKVFKYLGVEEFSESKYFKPLSWKQLKDLRETGLVTIGTHTHSHPILSKCTLEEQKTEIETSSKIIREHFDKIDSFAYPNGRKGDFSKITKQILKDNQYNVALSTIPGLYSTDCDLYSMPRVNIGYGIDMKKFLTLMAGL